jgi:hypothetical protein
VTRVCGRRRRRPKSSREFPARSWSSWRKNFVGSASGRGRVASPVSGNSSVGQKIATSVQGFSGGVRARSAAGREVLPPVGLHLPLEGCFRSPEGCFASWPPPPPTSSSPSSPAGLLRWPPCLHHHRHCRRRRCHHRRLP